METASVDVTYAAMCVALLVFVASVISVEAALSAALLFVAGVATSLIATDLDAPLKLHRVWVCVVVAVALAIIVVTTFVFKLNCNIFCTI